MAQIDSIVLLEPRSAARAALVFGFEREGYRVRAVADTAEALAHAGGAHVLVVSVESDEDQPTESGDPLRMIGLLREDAATQDLPIVVLGVREHREEALRAGADEFVSQPAFIRDVVTLAKLAAAIRQAGRGDGFSGLLDDYGLYFLARALAVAGRSGTLELERAGRQGQLRLSQGEVVAARVGELAGADAFHHLLLWGEATMRFGYGAPAGERQIGGSTEELLDSGAGFARELERIAARIGGMQAVLAVDPSRLAAMKEEIPEEVQGLLGHLDGHRPLIDLVEDSPFKAFDTVRILHRLLERGVIDQRRAGAEVSPLTAKLEVRDWLLGVRSTEPRSTVTEAGRRAAEAYAAERAAREAASTPGDDLFGEQDRARLAGAVSRDLGADAPRSVPSEAHRVPASSSVPVDAAPGSAGEAAAPAERVEDQPTAPRETTPGPTARNKPRRARDAVISTGPAAAPFSEKPAAPQPAPDRAPGAAPKAAGFDDVDEAFFAQEAELATAEPPDDFRDLEPNDAPSEGRRWSLFGASRPKSGRKRGR